MMRFAVILIFWGVGVLYLPHGWGAPHPTSDVNCWMKAQLREVMPQTGGTQRRIKVEVMFVEDSEVAENFDVSDAEEAEYVSSAGRCRKWLGQVVELSPTVAGESLNQALRPNAVVELQYRGPGMPPQPTRQLDPRGFWVLHTVTGSEGN